MHALLLYLNSVEAAQRAVFERYNNLRSRAQQSRVSEEGIKYYFPTMFYLIDDRPRGVGHIYFMLFHFRIVVIGMIVVRCRTGAVPTPRQNPHVVKNKHNIIADTTTAIFSRCLSLLPDLKISKLLFFFFDGRAHTFSVVVGNARTV